MLMLHKLNQPKPPLFAKGVQCFDPAVPLLIMIVTNLAKPGYACDDAAKAIAKLLQNGECYHDV